MTSRFRLADRGTDPATEAVAGVTTFLTMAYIVVVHPGMLATTGMDAGALLTVTCLAAAAATVMMALFTNLPFALAPGMGLNAFFAFTVCGQMGVPWRTALAVVFLEGLLFVALTALGVREALVRALPGALKDAVSAGIGLFLALIGLKNAGLVVAHPATLVGLGDLGTAPAQLALGGLVLTGALVARGVRGALMAGVLGVAAAAWVSGAAPAPAGLLSAPPSPAPLVGALDLAGALALPPLTLASVLLAFFFVDFFDTLGTLVGVSAQAGYLDDEGRLPEAKGAFLADALGTTLGAWLGTSTVTTYIESAAGVRAGGRTGLAGLVTAACFLAVPFFAPVIAAVPAFATTPALVVVGLFMIESLVRVDFSDVEEGLPAFLTVVVMPFTFSIAEGIAAGVVSWVALKLAAGKAREVPPAMGILAAVLVARHAWL